LYVISIIVNVILLQTTWITCFISWYQSLSCFSSSIIRFEVACLPSPYSMSPIIGRFDPGPEFTSSVALTSWHTFCFWWNVWEYLYVISIIVNVILLQTTLCGCWFWYHTSHTSSFARVTIVIGTVSTFVYARFSPIAIYIIKSEFARVGFHARQGSVSSNVSQLATNHMGIIDIPIVITYWTEDTLLVQGQESSFDNSSINPRTINQLYFWPLAIRNGG